jgi:hypothetical protein
MLKYQADRMPIGIHFISFTPFTNRNIEIKKGDYLYLFSDGYADQFGGTRGKKFMYKPFQDLLLRHSSKPMELQKEILDNTFEKWKNDYECDGDRAPYLKKYLKDFFTSPKVLYLREILIKKYLL